MITGAGKEIRHKVVFGILVGLVISSVCQAQGDDDYWSRNRRYEVFAEIQDLSGDTASGSFAGLSLSTNMDDAAVFGAGIGVNLTRRININVEVLHGSTDTQIDSSILPRYYSDTDYWFFNANLEYYLFRGPVTPVVGGGFGIAKFEGKLSPAAPFKESEFSSNYILGIRWDVRKRIAFKILYQSMKTDFGSDSISLGGVKAVACFMFE